MNTSEKLLTLGQAIALGMMIATGWMAYETRQLSLYSREMLELQSQPILSLAGLPLTRIQTDTNSGSGMIQVKIQLKNPTAMPIYFRFTDVRLSIDDKIPSQPFTHQVSDVLVGPGDTRHLLCYPVENIPTVMSPKQAKLFYKFQYWVPGKTPQEQSKNLLFITNTENPEWIEMPLPAN